jgi:hypothetical protein
MRDVLNSFLKIAKLIITRDLEELRVIYGAPQCALPKGGTLKVDKLDRLPLLHKHRNQSKVRTRLTPPISWNWVGAVSLKLTFDIALLLLC